MMGRNTLLVALLGAAAVLVPSRAAFPDFFRISRDSIVQGSTAAGGLQPDYLIRFNDPDLQPLLQDATTIGRSRKPYWERVDSVVKLVARAFPRREYDNPTYLQLMSDYRTRGEPIPLGQYVKHRVGTCREHYLLLHLALLRAGVPNKAVYARIEHGGIGYPPSQEDHGFVVLKGRKGDGWTADSYFGTFNGVRFEHLLRDTGITSEAELSPVGTWTPNHRKVVEVRKFPKVRPLEPNVRPRRRGGIHPLRGSR